MQDVYKSRDANVPSGTCPRAHNTVLALIDEGIMAGLMTGTERGSYNWLITQGGADNTGPDVMGQMPAPWVWQCDNEDIMNNRGRIIIIPTRSVIYRVSKNNSLFN